MNIKEKEPLVSIIMGVYNCENFLDSCIDSIFSQTYKNWELIICDDGSVDSSFEIAKKYKDRNPDKIILLRNNKNLGLNYTLNNCLKHVRGEYIARQDADDLSYNNRIKKEVDFLESNPKYSFVSANMELFDENGVFGSTVSIPEPTKSDLITSNRFVHGISMVKRECYAMVNGYSISKKLIRVEDYHLWIKMYARGYRGYNIQEILYRCRDNAEAFDRRTWENRINECRVKIIAIKTFNEPVWKYVYVMRPIIVGLLPKKIYSLLHLQRYKGNVNN